jgi:uncharacterized protein involved in type VI secretion and phage assembly
MGGVMERDVIRLLLEHVRSRHFGKYRGTVKDNKDPKQKGRLKVSVPSLLPPSLEVWAMPCVPYAGDKVGFAVLPAAGAGVWVEFEGGDLSFPIWVGCFWADGEAPESANPDIKQLKTEKLVLRLDDAEQQAKLAPDSGASLTLTTEAVTTASTSKHTVSPTGVSAEASPRKTELTAASFSVNGGALEVM